jgi:hypothetical protein
MDEAPVLTDEERERASAWVRESDTEAALELRFEIFFEIFMDELEAHADPTFGEGGHPEINRAAQALIDALQAEFLQYGEWRRTPAPRRTRSGPRSGPGD